MSPPIQTLQRIASLTPLARVLAQIEASVAPVAAQNIKPDGAVVGATLAADVIAPADFPQHPTALHDGWAVASEQTSDASSYAPAILNKPPLWINAGEPMPAGCDAILPVDALSITNGCAEILAGVAPGEGMIPARADAAKGMILRKAGTKMRAVDVAVFRALAVETISIRLPRVKILSVTRDKIQPDINASMIATAIRAMGAAPEILHGVTLDTVLAKIDCDFMIAIGGTGTGKNDSAVKTLARLGAVDFHGFGIAPGETAALGSVSGHPVLLLPGRPDAALAAFLLVGSKLLSQLSGLQEIDHGTPVTLAKKMTSTIGLAEVVFVRRTADGAEPLGTSSFPLQALAQADGWVLVPAQSEGLAAGAVVEIRSLP